MRSEFFNLTVALLIGVLLGAVFFMGLLWTVKNVVSGRRSPVWFLPSLLARSAFVVGGFYCILAYGLGERSVSNMETDWRPFISAMIGFLIARFAIKKLGFRKFGRHANYP